MNRVHYSSQTDEWKTPADFFGEFNNIFHFKLDAYAGESNAKCERYFTHQDDALRHEWTGNLWINASYERRISDRMWKTDGSSLDGATVVGLVPCRTDTHRWHAYAKRRQIIYLRGRIKFGGSRNAAHFPSAIVVFWSGQLGEAVSGPQEVENVLRTSEH